MQPMWAWGLKTCLVQIAGCILPRAVWGLGGFLPDSNWTLVCPLVAAAHFLVQVYVFICYFVEAEERENYPLLRSEPWLTFSALAVIACVYTGVLIAEKETDEVGKVSAYLFVWISAVQVLAWSHLYQYEAWWKRTDYVWVLVGTLALLGSGLFKIRSDHYRDGAKVHGEKMNVLRGRVLNYIDYLIALPPSLVPADVGRDLNPDPRIPIRHVLTREEYDAYLKRRDLEIKWLVSVRDKLKELGPLWTPADLDGLLASLPAELGRSMGPGMLPSLAREFGELDRDKASYEGAKEMFGREIEWMYLSPIALTLAIGLRLGKTSAEVRKLRPKPAPDR